MQAMLSDKHGRTLVVEPGIGWREDEGRYSLITNYSILAPESLSLIHILQGGQNLRSGADRQLPWLCHVRGIFRLETGVYAPAERTDDPPGNPWYLSLIHISITPALRSFRPSMKRWGAWALRPEIFWNRLWVWATSSGCCRRK